MRNKISLIIMVVSTALLFFSVYKIIEWKMDNNATEKLITNINDVVEIEELEDENVVLSEISQNRDIVKKDYYWKFVELPLMKVNFANLNDINSDTVAFINVPSTNINYPIVQTYNNDYYLNHTYDRSNNGAGWVFLDYRNNLNELSSNSVIYAHGRVDNTMFGTLKNTLTKEWLDNPDNYYIRLITPGYSSIWQVFSVYRVKTESYYLQTTFSRENEKLEFYNKLLNRSTHDFNTSIDVEDKLLTLSSCYNQFEKVVIHAKLIKQGYYK